MSEKFLGLPPMSRWSMTHGSPAFIPAFVKNLNARFLEFIQGRSGRRYVEQPFINGDGETRWIQTRSHIERTRGGKPLVITSICIDVTGEKALELALR